jgi:TPR repeat protein
MYANGDGVPQDCFRAHMWFNLAAAQGAQGAAVARTACWRGFVAAAHVGKWPTSADFGSASGGGLLRFDVVGADHLAPLFGFVGDELAEIGGRANKHRAAEVSQPRLHWCTGRSSLGYGFIIRRVSKGMLRCLPRKVRPCGPAHKGTCPFWDLPRQASLPIARPIGKLAAGKLRPSDPGEGEALGRISSRLRRHLRQPGVAAACGRARSAPGRARSAAAGGRPRCLVVPMIELIPAAPAVLTVLNACGLLADELPDCMARLQCQPLRSQQDPVPPVAHPRTRLWARSASRNVLPP